MKNKRKVIDVKNKNEEEILNIYKKIAVDSSMQSFFYDKVKNKKAALKLYDLYETTKKHNKKD